MNDGLWRSLYFTSRPMDSSMDSSCGKSLDRSMMYVVILSKSVCSLHILILVVAELFMLD